MTILIAGGHKSSALLAKNSAFGYHGGHWMANAQGIIHYQLITAIVVVTKELDVNTCTSLWR
ncbi:MAG TPA: hypothetical protein ENH48_12730, partial [Halieaceae bacterium]|nr:hypothetical protein [Halieaceae bacterium]